MLTQLEPTTVSTEVFPKLVQSVQQIEITSRCNLSCVYCVSPNLKRPKVDMTDEIWDASLRLVKRYHQRYGPQDISLFGIGESFLHPNFVEYVRQAREMLGSKIRLTVASNGIAVTEDFIRSLVPYNLRIYVSAHRPDKIRDHVQIIQKYGLLESVSMDPIISGVNWAGQLDWPVNAPSYKCPWLEKAQVMIMADGRITACCFDGGGYGVVGNVLDESKDFYTQPYSLCTDCNQYV